MPDVRVSPELKFHNLPCIFISADVKMPIVTDSAIVGKNSNFVTHFQVGIVSHHNIDHGHLVTCQEILSCRAEFYITVNI